MKNNTSLSEFFDNFRRKKGTANFTSSLIAIGIGLVIGIVILLVSNPAESFAGFFTMLVGGFNDGTRSLGNVFYFATPIIMTGLAVGFAFKTGLFNIGASGQFIVGAYVAVLVGVKLPVLAVSMGRRYISCYDCRSHMGCNSRYFKSILKCS